MEICFFFNKNKDSSSQCHKYEIQSGFQFEPINELSLKTNGEYSPHRVDVVQKLRLRTHRTPPKCRISFNKHDTRGHFFLYATPLNRCSSTTIFI